MERSNLSLNYVAIAIGSPEIAIGVGLSIRALISIKPVRCEPPDRRCFCQQNYDDVATLRGIQVSNTYDPGAGP
jgi:hypothetical protein